MSASHWLVVRGAARGPARHQPAHADLQLRQFETHGMVIRTAYAEIPPRVEYRLTPLGEGLRDVLDAMGAWAQAVPDPGPEPDAVP